MASKTSASVSCCRCGSRSRSATWPGFASCARQAKITLPRSDRAAADALDNGPPCSPVRSPAARLPIAALAAALAPVSPVAANAVTAQRPVSVQAVDGDSTVSGVADLAVTRERGGFRLSGYVRADRGCVELKTVNMHLGMYVGGDVVRRTCREGRQVRVSAWTHHTDVVLTAIVPGGTDWDSRIVTLTGG